MAFSTSRFTGLRTISLRGVVGVFLSSSCSCSCSLSFFVAARGRFLFPAFFFVVVALFFFSSTFFFFTLLSVKFVLLVNQTHASFASFLPPFLLAKSPLSKFTVMYFRFFVFFNADSAFSSSDFFDFDHTFTSCSSSSNSLYFLFTVYSKTVPVFTSPFFIVTVTLSMNLRMRSGLASKVPLHIGCPQKQVNDVVPSPPKCAKL